MRLLSLGLFALASASASVLSLTSANFDEHIGKDKPALVKFFAPWCGHCKAMAPDYEIVASTFPASDPVIVAEVNADDEKELGARFGIKGFPTLKFFPAQSSEAEDYNGGRGVDDLVSFLNQKAGLSRRVAKAPTAVQELTADDFDAVVLGSDLHKHRLVEYYASWCGHCKSLAPVYEKVGAAFAGDARVSVIKIDTDKNRAVGEKYGISGFPTLKVRAGRAGGRFTKIRDLSRAAMRRGVGVCGVLRK